MSQVNEPFQLNTFSQNTIDLMDPSRPSPLDMGLHSKGLASFWVIFGSSPILLTEGCVGISATLGGGRRLFGSDDHTI